MPNQKFLTQNTSPEDVTTQDTTANEQFVQDIKSPWHPAFYAAVQLELEMNLDRLELHTEYCLGKEPMRIDFLIIKKDSDLMIQKNFGQIFRTYNLISYKSPDDYLSINDFYKAYGYACFLQADTEKVCEIDPNEITVTYVCYYYPKKMLEHIRQVRHTYAREREPGIYDLTGDSFVMQLIVTSKLSPERNFWLSYLRNNVKTETEIKKLLERYVANKDSSNCRAVFDRILQANSKWMKEGKYMLEAVYELFKDEIDAREELGRKQGVAIGEKQGIKLAKDVFRLYSNGASTTEIAANCHISEDVVKEILN